jgi:diguanylate cyclase (GGDEF)-like protein
MRLAAEVERLAAELAATRTRINELESRIDVDSQTETLNRRGFERELKRSLAYVKRYGVGAALIYLDLDEFKPVNDRYGHAAGDAVLKAIAATLIRNVRSSDIVARIGGDEFVALIWNVNEAEAAAKAVALEAAVGATSVRFGGARLSVGASAGATVLAPLDTPARALARADVAMYARKTGSKRSLRARGRRRNQAMMSGVS